MEQEMEKEYLDLLWKQYQVNVELYRHYVELVIKSNAFFYTITGGLLSFFFTKATIENASTIRWSLAIPIVMSFLLGVFFFVSTYSSIKFKEFTVWLIKKIEIRDDKYINSAPDVFALSLLLFGSAILMLLVCIGCILAFFYIHLIVN